jgi:hypothetical protein
MPGEMTVQRLNHVGVVVDDLAAPMAFFVALGMELEGERLSRNDGCRPRLTM